MHWTTNQWTCLHCGVRPGQTHLENCTVRNTTAAVMWLGPPVTPGMLPREVVEGDLCMFFTCLHCEKPFEVGDTIFENRSQSLGLHGNCILLLAGMIPRDMPTPEEIEIEYQQRLAEVLKDKP